jgi:hypothetical protein
MPNVLPRISGNLGPRCDILKERNRARQKRLSPRRTLSIAPEQVTVAPESSASAYRREGDHTLIEIRLREVRQLFHTLDPAPFREKDLDEGAEEYLIEACREVGSRCCAVSPQYRSKCAPRHERFLRIDRFGNPEIHEENHE